LGPLLYKSCTVRGKKKGSPDGKPFYLLAPRPGLEPGTCGLTVGLLMFSNMQKYLILFNFIFGIT
jgi:hypothetical protein